MSLIGRWMIVAVALIVAVVLIPGIRVDGTSAWIAVGAMAVVLGLVNALARNILTSLGCGFILPALGLLVLVLNALTLWLSSWITQNWLNIGFYVDGFWPALWGGIVVGMVSFVVSLFLVEEWKAPPVSTT